MLHAIVNQVWVVIHLNAFIAVHNEVLLFPVPSGEPLTNKNETELFLEMLQNRQYFRNKTVVISGGSRGIGLAIALKLAADNANIVILSKTDQTHQSLPGTIYTAKKAIEDAGGKCLACKVDVRYEKEIQDAINATVETFGPKIDVLINNASAISLTPTSETNMKRFDLMHSINARGTFLLTKICLPYLKNASNAHVLNISPPLTMNAHWFAPHVAYTMSKYGMSMCTLGMSEEFKSGRIAVNSLWPKTMVWTAAIQMVMPDPKAKFRCRRPEIMADAAFLLLQKPTHTYTGNFAIDEEVLRDAGLANFDHYAYEPNAQLLPDAFLPNNKL